MLNRCRDLFISFKYYLVRGTSYLSLINTGMILVLFLMGLQDKGVIDLDIGTYTPIFFVLGLAAIGFMGWFEVEVIKGTQKENTLSFDRSPPFVELKKEIHYVYNKMKEAEAKQGSKE